MIEKFNRIEVWFKSGLFRALPNVVSYEEDDEKYVVLFGKDRLDTGVIYKSAIEFLEFMESENN